MHHPRAHCTGAACPLVEDINLRAAQENELQKIEKDNYGSSFTELYQSIEAADCSAGEGVQEEACRHLNSSMQTKP